MTQHGDAGGGGCQVVEQAEPLRYQCIVEEMETRRIATRPVETGNEGSQRCLRSR